MSYFYVIKKTFESRVFYVKELVIVNIPIIFQMFLGLFVGLYLHGINPVFFSVNEVLVYYFFSGIINIFQRGNPIYKVEHEVLTGNINVHFVKPYNFINYILVKDLSVKVWKLFLSILITYPILFFVYNIEILPVFLIRAIMTIPLSIFFIFINYSIFSYLAMIFERIRRLFTVYSILGYFIGGGFVSASYFPNFIKFLPQYFFFGAHLEFIINGVFINAGLFAFYLAVFTIINFFLKKIVMRRIETNG